MTTQSHLKPVAPLDLWSEPILRLSGMRSLCRSDYVLVTPYERDRLVSEGYAKDYQAPPAESPASPELAVSAALEAVAEPERPLEQPLESPEISEESEVAEESSDSGTETEPESVNAPESSEVAGDSRGRRGRRGGSR